MVALQDAAQAMPETGKTIAELMGDIQEGFANVMGDHPLAAAVLLVPAGIAFLLYGFRLYRWLVVIAYVGIGVVLGMAAALYLNVNQSVGIMLGAIILGVLAWPLHRVAWGVLGGILFAWVFVEVAYMMDIRATMPLFLVGAVAFVAGIALTVLLLKPLIVVITSLVGATFVALGVLSLTRWWPALGGPVERVIDMRPYIPVAIVLILAIVGSLLQLVDTGESRKKKKKKRKKSAGDE